MVLPNLGRSVRLDALVAEWEAAKEKGAEETRRWASQHLNVEIGLALHADRWRGADYWEGASEPGLSLDELLARCEVVVAGVDGGGLDDLYGLCIAGRDAITKDWLFWFRAWVQSDVLELRKDIADRLRDFADQGDLVLCDEPTQDVQEIADILERVFRTGKFPAEAGIGVDRYGIGALIAELAGRGIGEPLIAGVPQGAALSSAVWMMERLLKAGTLHHGGQPLVAWCVGNAKAQQKGNAVYITKEVAGKAKIDPLIAGFNAAKLLEGHPEAAGRSIYEERGILIL